MGSTEMPKCKDQYKECAIIQNKNGNSRQPDFGSWLFLLTEKSYTHSQTIMAYCPTKEAFEVDRLDTGSRGRVSYPPETHSLAGERANVVTASSVCRGPFGCPLTHAAGFGNELRGGLAFHFLEEQQHFCVTEILLSEVSE